MNVIEEMHKINGPIYTVHDNFITTPDFADRIPGIYTNAFKSLGPPLVIINNFIYRNLIKPVDEDSCLADFSQRFITPKELEFYLRKNVPLQLNKKQRITWDDKISAIITNYKKYIRDVCGDVQSTKSEDHWNAHLDKWDRFKYKLNNKHREINYSVHY